VPTLPAKLLMAERVAARTMTTKRRLALLLLLLTMKMTAKSLCWGWLHASGHQSSHR
jgi:hypothetical protein